MALNNTARAALVEIVYDSCKKMDRPLIPRQIVTISDQPDGKLTLGVVVISPAPALVALRKVDWRHVPAPRTINNVEPDGIALVIADNVFGWNMEGVLVFRDLPAEGGARANGISGITWPISSRISKASRCCAVTFLPSADYRQINL